MRAGMHFVGVVWTRDDTLTTRDASLEKVTEFRFGVLPFWIMTPEAMHGASFQEHGRADARTIVQGETLNVKNNVSSVHCSTVREGSIAIDAAFSAFAEEAGNHHDHRLLLASLSGLY